MESDAALAAMTAAVIGLFVLWTWERARQAAQLEVLLPPSPSRNLRRTRPSKSKLTEEQVSMVCAEVAARLRAGDPVQAAWDRTVLRLVEGSNEDPMDVLARSGESGQLVLTALRFGEQTGAPLAAIMERTAFALSEKQKANDALQVAFAGPKASARVLSLLPLVGLLGGELLGANSIGWFLGGSLQLLLAAVGVGLAVAGNLVSQVMIRQAMNVGRGQQLAPVYCDLAVAALQSGMAIPAVLGAISSSSSERAYGRIGRELELGATWSEAWDGGPDSGELLRHALEPSWADGVSPVLLLAGAAEQARSRSVGDAKKAAEKLGVKLAFPLGLLLLPSFVVLGLLPVLFSLVGGQMTGLFG